MTLSRLLVYVSLLVAMIAIDSRADQSSLLFHASFEQGATADVAHGQAEPIWPRVLRQVQGPVGQAISLERGNSTLVYRMPGNAYTNAGTLSFYWRMDQDIDHAEFPVLNLGGYQKIYFGRWMRLYMTGGRLLFQHFDSHRDARRTRFGFGDFRPQPHTWYHIAVTWDQARGVGIYLDGQPVRVIDRPWFLQANLNHLSLGQHSTSYTPAGRSRSSRSMSFDEIKVYDRWLSDTDIEALSRGEMVTPTAAGDPGPLADWRRQVYSWQASPDLPTISEQGLGLRQVGIVTAKDVKRTEMTAFDGQLASAWQRSGYTQAGQKLDVQLQAGSRFNVVQAFSHGRFDLHANGRSVMQWQVDDTLFTHRTLEPGIEADRVAVHDRDQAGKLMSLALLEADSYAAVRASAAGAHGRWEDSPMMPGDLAADDSPQSQRMRLEYAPGERTLLLAGESSLAAAGSPVTLPAMQAVHLLGPTVDQRRGLQAVSLDWPLAGPTDARVMRVEVIDPLNYNRRAFAADVAISRQAAESQRLQLVIDLRDLILRPGHRPWIVLTFDQPVVIEFQGDGTTGFAWCDVAAALPEFFADQLNMAEQVFSSLSEARPWGWDPSLVKKLGYIRNIFEELLVLEPDNVQLQGYWQWINPSDPKPIVDLPAAPVDVPPWAHHLTETVALLKQTAYWWIDHRMTEQGEFGANDGINDDTDLIQDWLNLDLMAGPDEKIRDAVRRVADNSWHNTMQDGLGRSTDILHHYEWGLNAQTLLAVMDYGCPVAVERLMATARRMDELMVSTEHGRQFITQRFGYNWVRTSGPDGWDTWANALTLQPNMILAWYNGNPQALTVLHEWVRAMVHHTRALEDQQRRRMQGVSVHAPTGRARLGGTTHGFVTAVWGAYDLTGDPDLLEFLGQLIELDLKLSEQPAQTARVLARYLNEAASHPQHQQRYHRLAEQVTNWLPDETLWQQSLHNSNYRQLDWFYHLWQTTGQTAWLDEGLKLTHNDLVWSLPLLTEAEHSTDRVWLPQRLVNRVMLGDIAILRNELYPGHAVGWQNATGRIAPLVLEHARDRLRVVIHNLDNQPVQADMQIWRLDHGRYRFTTTTGQQTTQQEVTLKRGEVLPVALPPGQEVTLTLEQTQRLGDIRQQTDVAITHRDASFDEAAGTLTVRVHNIGSLPTGAIRLVARQADAVLLDQQLDSLDAPLDLLPRVVDVQVPISNQDHPVAVELELINPTEEITTTNNRMDWTFQ